jgi:mRNA interferase RelE/StbE
MYRLQYHPAVLARDLPTLDGSVRERVAAAIEGRLLRAPEAFGKPLSDSLSGSRSLRVGDWRIAYMLRGPIVSILSVQHRSKRYDGVAERLCSFQ